MLESCPVQFTCEGEAAPEASTSVASPASTAEDPNASVGNEPEPCEGYSPGDACIDDANLAQCREAAARCPGRVQVLESCPVQFTCP
jgi:hypothetical protein